jgi:hypothetical protein
LLLVVVTASVAGTVIVAVPFLVVSVTEVAVTVAVSVVLEAAGGVYVAEVVVWPDSAPPPLTFHVTPAAFLSLVTVAVSVTVFAPTPSTLVADAVTVTLTEPEPAPEPPPLEPPPQPDRLKAAIIVQSAARRPSLLGRLESCGEARGEIAA